MAKSHPLAKLRFLLAIIWAILLIYSLLYSKETGQNIWLLYNIVLIGLSVATVYLGWLMIVKKESVFTLYESVQIRFTEKAFGQKTSKDLVSKLSKPNRRKWLGIMNLIVGMGLLILAIMGLALLVSG
jgi:hypothetical protein